MENNQKGSKNRISLEVTKGRSIGVNLMDEESGRKGIYFLEHTHHSQARSKQRGISNMMITLTIEYGKVFQRQGLEFYVLGNRGLPDNIDHHIQDKVKNTVVVVGEGGQIVTCYKGSQVMRHIHRKQKYLVAA